MRQPNFPHSYKEYEETIVDQVVERLADADIAIINKVQTPRREPRKAAEAEIDRRRRHRHRLRGQGLLQGAQHHGLEHPQLCRQHGAGTYARADLRAAPQPCPYVLDVRRGKWQTINQFCYFDHPIRDIADLTLGLIGYGGLGKSVGKRAEALGMKIIATDVYDFPDKVDLDTILRQSDVISLHCPLTDQTRNVIGAPELKKMKKDAILINTARGGLVDEKALVEALKSREIGGAGFDVSTVEPPKNGNVLLDADLPNLLITPHVAWASVEAMTGLSNQLVDNIEAWAAGKPRNRVLE